MTIDVPPSSPDMTQGQGKASFRHIVAKVWNHHGLDFKAKAKILGRALFSPQRAVAIEQTLGDLGIASLSAVHPRLFEKCNRAYLIAGLNPDQKLELVCAHYRTLAHHFDPQAIQSIYSTGTPVLSAELAPYDAAVRLHYDSSMEKEGELTLSLDLAGRRAYSMALTLGTDTLYIGSLQGSKSAYEEIRRFTKASHGVRPHNFLLVLARIVAANLGLTHIRAISNEKHVYRMRKRTQERIQFDYDTFWGETGGTPTDSGFFDLPLAQPRKDLAEIAANKRAQYRRRYEFLDLCADGFNKELDRIKP